MWSSNYRNYFQHSNSYERSLNDVIEYNFQFHTENSLPENSLIEINYPINPDSSFPCYVHLGLEDISEGFI